MRSSHRKSAWEHLCGVLDPGVLPDDLTGLSGGALYQCVKDVLEDGVGHRSHLFVCAILYGVRRVDGRLGKPECPGLNLSPIDEFDGGEEDARDPSFL